MSTELKKAPEQRTATVEVADVKAEGRTLSGFAALYGVESRDLGGFTEIIEPGAFGDVLAGEPDVYLTFNHSPDKILARTTSKTLRLRDEDRGLAFEADLGDGPTAQDVREMVKRGDVSGASFRFVVDAETWQGEVRSVTKIAELIDLSLATTPAYDGPKVELRSREPAPIERTDVETETKTTEPEERAGPPEERTETGTRLTVESRSEVAEERTIDQRIEDGLRSVRKGESRALTTAISISPQELSTTLFDRLRARSVVLGTGISTLSTERDSVVYPLLTADLTADATAEAATITPSDPTFSTTTATPRKMAALTQVSNEVLDDSDPSLAGVLNDHLMKVLALKLDQQLLEGS
ncbi:MAG: HK97 family phage prohead protease, partial [Solirubrobacterales bacterium]